jgi:Na+-transporting methylmalonyl-CoA/oxaloacetate decarboxylase beta subunit
MNLGEILYKILQSLPNFYWGSLVMILVGIILIYLAIAKEYEPVLLLPIGFGCILANL